MFFFFFFKWETMILCPNRPEGLSTATDNQHSYLHKMRTQCSCVNRVLKCQCVHISWHHNLSNIGSKVNWSRKLCAKEEVDKTQPPEAAMSRLALPCNTYSPMITYARNIFMGLTVSEKGFGLCNPIIFLFITFTSHISFHLNILVPFLGLSF